MLLVLACVLASGCSQWKNAQWLPWEKEEPQAPDKVVAMWTNTVLTAADKPATRGFGGRLMFYREAETKPILVEGSLIVYAFDETHRKPDDPRPDRKFVFTPEQFERHYSKSDIGHSYSVWLPWDEASGPPIKVSLIVRFMSHKGGLVLGEQSTHLLPGPGQEATATSASTPPAADTAAAINPVRAVGYQAPAAQALLEAPGASSRVRTTTIDIPMQSRLCRGPSGAQSAPLASRPAEQAAAAPVVAPAAPTSARARRFGVERLRPLGQPLAAPRPTVSQQATTNDGARVANP